MARTILLIRPRLAGQDEEAQLTHHDRGAAHAFALDQAEQNSGIARIEPHAAMRGRPAQLRNLVGAVDGESAIEEDRMRHRGIIVFAREPAPGQHLRVVGARRCNVSPPRRRNPPVVARHAVDDDGHSLTRAVDVDDDGGFGAIARGQDKEAERGKDVEQATHMTPAPPPFQSAPK